MAGGLDESLNGGVGGLRVGFGAGGVQFR
jgi:hypothetical protein